MFQGERLTTRAVRHTLRHMAFTVYLADSTTLTYEEGYHYEVARSGTLFINGNGRARTYAPHYWTQVDEPALTEEGGGDRHDLAPAPEPVPYYQRDTQGPADVPDI